MFINAKNPFESLRVNFVDKNVWYIPNGIELFCHILVVCLDTWSNTIINHIQCFMSSHMNVMPTQRCFHLDIAKLMVKHHIRPQVRFVNWHMEFWSLQWQGTRCWL